MRQGKGRAAPWPPSQPFEAMATSCEGRKNYPLMLLFSPFLRFNPRICRGGSRGRPTAQPDPR